MKAYAIAFLASFGVLAIQDAMPAYWGMMLGKVALTFVVFACVLGRQGKWERSRGV